MLWQRVATAIPLAALVLWIILWQPTRVFDGLLLVVVLVAGYEWARLAGIVSVPWRVLYALAPAVLAAAVLRAAPAWAPWLTGAAVIWWLSVSFYLRQARPRSGVQGLQAEKALTALLLIPAAALAMHFVHAMPQGRGWLMYALALVWVADIGAYFSGKRFGRIKLSPHISPGKTREGLYGALAATSLYTLAATFYFGLGRDQAVLLMLLSLALTLISVSGDLYVSFLKREVGLKDTGRILPGHGGMLDRIDSVLAAMPVFAAGFHWLISPVVW